MKKNNLLLGALLVVALIGAGLVVMFIMAVVLLGGPDDAGDSIVPTRRQTIRTVSIGSGSGNEVSPDFTVSGSCPRQTLTYSGNAIDPDVESVWASFRAVDDNGRGAESVIGDFLDAPSGSTSWSLGPGQYVIEVEGWNAEWEYKLSCS